MCDISLLDFDPIMILKASILGGLKEDMSPPYSISPSKVTMLMSVLEHL
jgi:hypothetical protein